MKGEELLEILEKHRKWMECEDGGERADLRGANLQNADLLRADLWGVNLRGADLRGASIDYSCWPLWCGSLDVIVDKRIAAQLAYHFCRLICDDPEVKEAQQAIKGLANQFHRVHDCGEIP